MFNLFRSDVYRTVRSPFFWVITAIAVVLMLGAAGMMSWISSPQFTHMIEASVGGESMQGLPAEQQAAVQADLDASLAELESLHAKKLDSVTGMWAGAFLDGGFLGLLGSLFTALYLLADFKKGFVKNLPMDRRGRLRYYAEKVVFVAATQAFFLLVCAAASAASYALFGFTYEHADSAGGLAVWRLLAWLICTAYALLVACRCWAFRNEAVAAVAAAAVSSGIVGAFVTQLLLYAGKAVPVLGAVPQWLPVSAFANLRPGAESLGATNADYFFAQMPAWGHAALVPLLASAVMCVIVVAACRRKAIA